MALPVRLDEFVQNEVKRILGFASRYREVNKEAPTTFPLALADEGIWYRQYLNYITPKPQEEVKNETQEEDVTENPVTQTVTPEQEIMKEAEEKALDAA